MNKLRLTYISFLAAAMAIMLCMASCADDTVFPAVENGDGVTSVTLRIPNPGAAASRSAANDPDPSVALTGDEGKINTLWLLAYNTSGNGHVIRQLQSSGQVTHEYSDYKVTFKPGDYRFYVVANLDAYIDGTISADTPEETLKAMTLGFSPEKLPNLTDGIPMACLPAEISEAGDDGIVTIAAGENKTIHADMTFLCAKVRYTILFDNTAGGFSREAFGDNTIDFNGASVGNVIAATSLATPAATSSEGAFLLDTAPLGKTSYAEEPHATAWQGTLYLPENLLSGDDRSILYLEASLEGSDAKLHYTVELPEEYSCGHADNTKNDATDTEKVLRRGNFYDLIGHVTSLGDRLDLTAQVSDWTLLTLTYALHGPYFLHVDKTSVDVHAGVETRIKYETDAEQLSFESPKYENTELDLFEINTVEEDGVKYISITTNPDIPAQNVAGFNSYFYINAANLRKRIEVSPVTLDPFLNVTPVTIEINVREYIASGEYEAEIPISFVTNLKRVTISGDDSWDPSIALVGDKTYTDTSKGTNTIRLTGMNGGAFWKTERNLTLTYTAEGYPTPVTVNIHIVPNILNYLIHFRAPSGWTHPHIYVYQCLQLPADHSQNPGKTVGYKDGNDVYSALEYSFTGKIAFKGWNDPNNSSSASGSTDGNKGFFIFDYNQDSWNPNKQGFTDHYYDDFDFCKNHRDSVSDWNLGHTHTECNDCALTPNKTWPGILMHNDGNGWWTFELTGVATPGKALIMFSNGHSGDNGKRYPSLIPTNDPNVQISQPGIPLFDFPNREGWLDYANGDTQFVNAKPIDYTPEKYRIYWPYSDSFNGINMWGDGGAAFGNTSYPRNDYDNFISRPTARGTYNRSREYPGYAYFEFTATTDAKLYYQHMPSYDNKSDLYLSDFRTKSDRIGTYTLNIGSGGYAGVPNGITYRIYWRQKGVNTGTDYWRIYIADADNDNIRPSGMGDNPSGHDHETQETDGASNSGFNNNFYFYDFKITKNFNPERIKVIYFRPDGVSESETLYLSAFNNNEYRQSW